MKTIIFPGTFDPITRGHQDLIERASRLFDHVLVTVAFNDSKQPIFTLDERIELVQQTTAHLSNVSVKSFSGLLVDLVASENAIGVLRGLRNGSDLDYELPMAQLNQQMLASCETVFLSPAPEFAAISSTLVRQISSLGGDVSQFVDAAVLQALQTKSASH